MAETRHLTIMFTDIKGFTKATSVKKREEIDKYLDLHEQLVTPVFKKFRGKIVKTIGDAFMVVFQSPTNAVLCGIEIQEKLKGYNKNSETKEHVEVRIAVNSGEVHIRGKDVFGEAVNIASRIEGIAEPNEIYFTESVYLSMNKNEIPTAEVGYRKLKGISDEIKVYKVIREPRNAKKFRAKRARMIKHQEGSKLKAFWKKRKGIIIVAIVLLVLIIIASNPNNIIKREQNVNAFINSAERAINSGNYNEARKLASKLEKISEDEIPPKLALEGAKLYIFLRQPEDAFHMIQTAKQNFPTQNESDEISSYTNELLQNASPEQEEALKQLLNQA